MSTAKLPLFLSWSGPASRRVAEILKENVPLLLNAVAPWTSEEIEKGENWHAQLSVAIKDAGAAIVCITPTNLSAPWLNFESGALWSLGNAVCPFLFRLPKSSLAGTPLSHLQASEVFDDEDSRRLFWKLNILGGTLLSEVQFAKSFALWWPRVKDELAGVPGNPPNSDPGVTELVVNSIVAAEQPSNASELVDAQTTPIPSPEPPLPAEANAVRRKRLLARPPRPSKAIPFPDRRLTRSQYEQVFLKLVSGGKLKVDGDTYMPVGMKGWYHAIFRSEKDGAERLLTIDQLLKKLNDWS